MIRLWLAFLVFSVIIHFSIDRWRSINGKEKWALTKTIGYSMIISLLSVLVMTAIVILF